MDVQLNRTPTVRLVPTAPMSAPTASIIASSGEVLATATPAPSELDTTVAADDGNAADRFKLTDVADVEPGLSIRVTDPRYGPVRGLVRGVDGAFVELTHPLPFVPDDGSVVRGLDVLVTLPSAATDKIGMARRLEVVEGNTRASLVFNVVAYPIEGPCCPEHVRDTVTGIQASFPLDEQVAQQIADDVNGDIRRRLLASGVFASEYWDPAALKSLSDSIMELKVCRKLKIWPSNTTRDGYTAELKREIKEAAGEILKSAQPVDADLDGALTETEAKGVQTVGLLR